ncbi:formimidoylglutamate deiminase [Marinobacterium jannaschii]|uniref:formimidoylglutamate deiminase n=1 Tax=Marinobacterium jannaschii TaxID=64970 RepID=UPI00055AFA4E|nr:formimidoylglutamate deiminase [Marinobacterium jannaschii]
MKTSYFAETALLAEGWCSDVRFDVEDGRFVRICAEAPAEDADAEVIRLAGPVLPGMPNLHSHAFQRLMAGLAEVCRNPADSFWSWRELMYGIVAKLSPEDVGVIARQLYIEMLKAGYTQVAEFHYLHHQPDGQAYSDPAETSQRILAAADSSGIGVTLLPVLYSHADFGGLPASSGQRRFIHTTEDYLALQYQLDSLLEAGSRHRLGSCFHSLRAVTPEQITQVLAQHSPEWPIHIHIAEQQKEVDACLGWSGKRPVQWLLDNVGLDSRWCLIHATHLDLSEVEGIARSGAVTGLCPSTEANLGDGIFPGTDYLQHQGRFGIGSDSHVSLSISEELKILEYSQRLRDQQRNRLYGVNNPVVGDFLYRSAAQGGARACGIEAGEIASGKRADFIVLDNSHPFIATAQPEQLINRWVFALNENPVLDVYVAGQQQVAAGRHPLEERARNDFAQVLKRLL